MSDDMTQGTAGEHHHVAGEHHHGNEFTIPFVGMQMSLPGGIYTFVFVVLAILTVFEVAIANVLSGPFLAIILLAAAISKALLVMTYYMHLNRDTVLFRFVLALPLLIAVLSVLFLVALPIGAGLGYRLAG